MDVNDVLASQGIDHTKLIVTGGEKLVEGVARTAAASAAGDIAPKKEARSQQIHSGSAIVRRS